MPPSLHAIMWTFPRRDALRHLALAAVGACVPARGARASTSRPNQPATVTLVENGVARCAIFAPAWVLLTTPVKTSTVAAHEAEAQRVRLRDSIHDLATTLGKISGATIDVLSGPPPAGDPRIPLLVGDLASQAFGPPVHAPFKQGFRLAVSPRGVGFIGESDLATTYAIYELLHQLGCRWFMPSDLGEVLPSLPTITIPAFDLSSGPSTIYRGVWYADDAYRRRNRHGGLRLDVQQCLEGYISKDDRKRHPEWTALIHGKPDPTRLRWSNPTLAAAIADALVARLRADPAPSLSLAPEDGFDFDESDDRAIDAGDFDPIADRMSLTDRLLVLCNRIATRVTAEFPEVIFGGAAYAQFTRPPVREKVHPSIVPQIAPILYSRFHPMNDDAVPGNRTLRNIVIGWAAAARKTSFYAYAYNLAEVTAPQPMLAKWGFDVPFVLISRCAYWQPETLPNFETHMHALYMAGRLAWDSSQRPSDIYAEVNRLFYGHASQAMAEYWTFVDDVWAKTPEYAGAAFTYVKRWPPERLTRARSLLDAAKQACATPIETRRVELASDSLALFELYMKMRWDLADGRLRDLGHDAGAWRRKVAALADQYHDQYCFSRLAGMPATLGGVYFQQSYQRTYEDASTIATNFDVLTTPPIRRFRWKTDPERTGERAGWAKPELDDHAWKTTDVCLETWSSLGYHDYFKSMWYRAEVPVPPSHGAKTYLWLSGTDGSAKVFVNGIHVPFVDERGGTRDAFEGFCAPASFDVTAALKTGANSIALFCTRTTLNELGTGGLVGPVLLYREKPRSSGA